MIVYRLDLEAAFLGVYCQKRNKNAMAIVNKRQRTM